MTQELYVLVTTQWWGGEEVVMVTVHDDEAALVEWGEEHAFCDPDKSYEVFPIYTGHFRYRVWPRQTAGEVGRDE